MQDCALSGHEHMCSGHGEDGTRAPVPMSAGAYECVNPLIIHSSSMATVWGQDRATLFPHLISPHTESSLAASLLTAPVAQRHYSTT